MKNFLFIIFLIGMFAIGCNPPPGNAKPESSQTEFVQAADQVINADVINAVDETVLPAPDTPEPVKWLDENLLMAVSSVIGVAYEFLVRKIPSSKTLSIIGNLYKLINWFIPDKSKNGGTLQIREKL